MDYEQKKEPKVKEKELTGEKEASLLPGYIIVICLDHIHSCLLLWILGASLPHPGKFSPDQVFKFESGLHFENYANAWKAQNVSVFFANSLLGNAITACVGVILISAPAGLCCPGLNSSATRS